MRGATFYQLHLLLDKHASEQLDLVDKIAKRVQTLGGVAVGDPRHVAELTRVPRPPDGCEEVPAMLSRLLEAHEIILVDAHDAAARVAALGDDGTNDLLVSDVIRTGELQAWFLAEHLVDTPNVVVGLTTHILSAFRIEEMAVPHVENKIVFNAMCDWSVCIEAPDHGLACDVNMHDDFVAHKLDEQHRAPDDIVSLSVGAPVQNVFRSYAELDVFVRVGFHFVSFVRWQGQRHPA
jgi:DNA-binding ferritin-like protein